MQKVASVAIQIVYLFFNTKCQESAVLQISSVSRSKKKRALLRVKRVFHYKTFKITLFFLTQ